MITSFPNNNISTNSDQGPKNTNSVATNQSGNKVVRFANIHNLNQELNQNRNQEKAQYDQAKQAINQAASLLNW